MDAAPFAQILAGLIQRQQGFQRRAVELPPQQRRPVAGDPELVARPLAAFGVDADFRLSATSVVVQIRVQEVAVEGVERVGATGIDVTVADVLAYDRSVLSLNEAVIAGVSGPALGLLDAQLLR